MTTELYLLAASVILGLVHLIADSHLISWQLGYRWTASNREQPVPPLRGLAHRVDQAYTNFMETFPLFAALLLAAHVAGRLGPLTFWGAQLYFWGRVGYVLASAAGFRPGALRSLFQQRARRHGAPPDRAAQIGAGFRSDLSPSWVHGFQIPELFPAL